MRAVTLAAYLATIVVANWAVETFGPVPVGFGLMAPAGVYFAGLALSLRDAVQERFGREATVIAIILGGAVSALFGDISIAIASAAAFLTSEIADMLVYTPLRARNLVIALLASNLVGLLIDSALFLWLAFGSLEYLPGQLVGKMWATLAALAVLGAWRATRGASAAAAPAD